MISWKNDFLFVCRLARFRWSVFRFHRNEGQENLHSCEDSNNENYEYSCNGQIFSLFSILSFSISCCWKVQISFDDFILARRRKLRKTIKHSIQNTIQRQTTESHRSVHAAATNRWMRTNERPTTSNREIKMIHFIFRLSRCSSRANPCYAYANRVDGRNEKRISKMFLLVLGLLIGRWPQTRSNEEIIISFCFNGEIIFSLLLLVSLFPCASFVGNLSNELRTCDSQLYSVPIFKFDLGPMSSIRQHQRNKCSMFNKSTKW